MIHLGLLFDFSLSPTRPQDNLLQVSHDCLLPMLRWIEQRGGTGLTVCVNSWLTQTWLESYQFECLEKLRGLFHYGIIELTGTAAYHPVLPLLSAVEARRQVVLNTVQQRRLLGGQWEPFGFFPPELAYGHELAQLLPDLRFGWCLADDAFYGTLHGEVPWDTLPVSGDLTVLLRSRHWSLQLREKPGRALAAEICQSCTEWWGGQDGYLVLALPALCFDSSDRRHYLSEFVDELDRRSDVQVTHLSKLVERFPKRPAEVPPGSWKTSVDDFWNGEFFPAWQSRHSPIHQKLWYLTDLALQSAENLRERLDRALASHTFENLDQDSLRALVSLVEAAFPERGEEARQLAAEVHRSD